MKTLRNLFVDKNRVVAFHEVKNFTHTHAQLKEHDVWNN